MARSPKPRVHREWFQRLARKCKHCPTCKEPIPFGESIWSWGEYRVGKWRKIMEFCRECFPIVRDYLIAHKDGCGCTFELMGRHSVLPHWLTMEEESCENFDNSQTPSEAVRLPLFAGLDAGPGETPAGVQAKGLSGS